MLKVRKGSALEAEDKGSIVIWTKWGEFRITERDDCIDFVATEFELPPITILTPDGVEHQYLRTAGDMHQSVQESDLELRLR